MSKYSRSHEAATVYGAGLQTHGSEDYITGRDDGEFSEAVDDLNLALDALRKNVQAAANHYEEQAQLRIKVISSPEYYVNGHAVGNITKLLVNRSEDSLWYGGNEEEFKPMKNYKRARTVAYLMLLDYSIDAGDFSDMVKTATGTPDPYIASRLREDISAKKIRRPNYAWTPDYTIERQEEERERHNLQAEKVQTALMAHAGKSRDRQLGQEIHDSRHPLLRGMVHGISLRRHRGLNRIIYNEVSLPLARASLRPPIEEQIVSDVLGQDAWIQRR